jgi:hypothetical protein
LISLSALREQISAPHEPLRETTDENSVESLVGMQIRIEIVERILHQT